MLYNYLVLSMNIFIRTNFGKNIGLGHIMRTYRIALEFSKKKYNCIFFTDDKKLPFKTKFKTILMYKNTSKYKDEMLDAKLFCELTKNYNSGYVLLDDYRFNVNWEKYVSKKQKKIIIFDDIEKNKHFADTIINYNPKHYPKIKYNYKLNKKENSNFLIHPKYNIISATKFYKNYNFNKNNFYITIYMGGSGNLIIIYKILKNILKENKINLIKTRFLIIIGPYSINKKYIIELSKKNSCIEYVENISNLSYIIKNTDIFFGSSGTAIFETAYLKTSTILFQMEENQKSDIFSLEKLGHYFLLNYKDLQLTKKISYFIYLCTIHYKRIKKLKNKPELIIDTKGSSRIVNAIILNKNNTKNKIILSKNNVKLDKYIIKKVNDLDLNDYLFSRNNEINKKNSSSLNDILNIDHYTWWFTNKRNSFLLTKNGIRILYFFTEKIIIKDTTYLIPGFFICNNSCKIQDIVFFSKWQLKNSSKNIKWLQYIKKNNKALVLLPKYLFWNKIEFNNYKIKAMIKKNNLNYNDFNFYER